MSDLETLKVYAEKAQDYATIVAASGTQNPLLAHFIKNIPKAGHVLDLGCGPGNSAKQMADAGLTVTAMDAVPQMIALIPDHPAITPVIGTFDDITGSDIYDGVWANFSLLHAPRADMPQHLAALHTALKPDGVFHIALKTGDDTKRDRLGRQYTYYSESALRDVVTAAGFMVDSATTGRDVGLDGTPADWIALHAHG